MHAAIRLSPNRNAGEVLVSISLLALFRVTAMQGGTRMSQRADSVRERATATLIAWNRLQRVAWSR